MVDVFSPNHLELLALFGISSMAFDRLIIESLAVAFLKSGVGANRKGAVLVRAGENGCLTISEDSGPYWQLPYYESDHSKIVDTTGAGNAFLGGFAVGYCNTGDFLEASQYGSVAASFMLEQVSLPRLSVDSSSGLELWNGDDPRRRLNRIQSMQRT